MLNPTIVNRPKRKIEADEQNAASPKRVQSGQNPERRAQVTLNQATHQFETPNQPRALEAPDSPRDGSPSPTPSNDESPSQEKIEAILNSKLQAFDETWMFTTDTDQIINMLETLSTRMDTLGDELGDMEIIAARLEINKLKNGLAAVWGLCNSTPGAKIALGKLHAAPSIDNQDLEFSKKRDEAKAKEEDKQATKAAWATAEMRRRIVPLYKGLLREENLEAYLGKFKAGQRAKLAKEKVAPMIGPKKLKAISAVINSPINQQLKALNRKVNQLETNLLSKALALRPTRPPTTRSRFGASPMNTAPKKEGFQGPSRVPAGALPFAFPAPTKPHIMEALQGPSVASGTGRKPIALPSVSDALNEAFKNGDQANRPLERTEAIAGLLGPDDDVDLDNGKNRPILDPFSIFSQRR